jgi:hypothetical protein
MGAWVPSALTGLCFVNLPDQFVGPLGELAGGLDISLPVALTMACTLYVALLQCFPEPDGVYGPQGRRWLRGSHKATHAHIKVVEPRTAEGMRGNRMTAPREEVFDTQDAA